MKKLICGLLCLSILFCLASCGVWGKDERSDNAQYHYSQTGEKLTFTLELRNPTEFTEVAEGDAYPHSTIDGEIIATWVVPMYGNTVYESVVKFFEDRKDKITFRLSQHTFYMFHDCTLADGSVYNLETVYVAADGVYSNCANYQSVLGEDKLARTEDDLKILTLVYKGWLY